VDELKAGSDVTEKKEDEKPLTKEEVQNMIGEVDKKWQSVLDKKQKELTAEAVKYHKRAQNAESQIQTINELAMTNPQLNAQLRAAMTTAQVRELQARDTAERVEQEKQEFYDQVSESLKELDIDPADKRLDLAEDAKNATEATRRIMASIAKIQKEDKQKSQKKFEDDTKSKIRKEEGIDSVDNSTGGSGSVSFTVEQIKNMPPETRLKNMPKIREAISKGKLK
jgi:hypothetical protein